ncbi:interferon gamma 1 [Sardina pilchardus]|uniref:interferon gamma 1 n=1 Tax=Sardina pilchardus TaxID=27697 RepID=UPI002E118E1F
MATAAYHLKQALIWAVICLMAGEVMGNKDYFPKEMATRQSNLDKILAKGKGHRPVGALFKPQELSNLQEQVRMFLADETLKVYINILTKIHDNMQTKGERDDVDYLKSKMEELRTNYFNETQKQFEVFSRNLKELQAIDVTKEEVQRKAIYEMKRVYNQVSAVGWASKNQSKNPISSRRRRQLRRRSTKPRA